MFSGIRSCQSRPLLVFPSSSSRTNCQPEIGAKKNMSVQSECKRSKKKDMNTHRSNIIWSGLSYMSELHGAFLVLLE